MCQMPARGTLPLPPAGPYRGAGGVMDYSVDFRELTPGVINAACNAGGKLLRMVELEQRHRSGQMRREPMPLAQLGPVPEP